MWRHHRCGQNHHHPNRFYEELQVLRCKSQSHCSIDVLDILSMWSSTELQNVAWFATVEAKTAMRVFLHQVGAVQVHRLGGWRCSSSGRLGEGGGGGRGGGSSGSDNRRGVEQGWCRQDSTLCPKWLNYHDFIPWNYGRTWNSK